MVPLDFRERLLARTDALIFTLYEWLRLGIAWIFIIGIALVSSRALIIGLLALIEKLRPSPPDNADFQPPVSILIPAYNEESVIVDTVSRLWPATIRRSKLSWSTTDRSTAPASCSSYISGRSARPHHSPGESRKIAALTHALREAHSDIVVTIDADTCIAPDAVGKLVRHFADPRIGAVAGNVKVGNRNRWLTRWQALEYITSQNLEKRAFDLLNCIPVVPGALSAWRAAAIVAAGGFTSDTVAEDTDLTIAIRRAGWRITYDEEAIGWTEAPETADALMRQRFRWTFGTLQSFWKHRDTLGRPRYGTLGWVALPNIFLVSASAAAGLAGDRSAVSGFAALWGLGQLRMAHLPQLWTARGRRALLVFFHRVHADRLADLRDRICARETVKIGPCCGRCFCNAFTIAR